MHCTSVQAFNLLHSLHVVLLVDVHTDNSTTKAGIVKSQLPTYPMTSASYLTMRYKCYKIKDI